MSGSAYRTDASMSGKPGLPVGVARSRRRLAMATTSTLAILSVLGACGSAVAGEYLSGTNTISNQVFSGQSVTGGDGSGGGAGLGGAVFVGDGATVNLDSVDFLGNTATGGDGGVGDYGGGLNGRTTGTSGNNGAAGIDGDSADSGTAYVNDGDGGTGGAGTQGSAGSAGIGGTGGDGGDGSDGSATTADVVKTIAEQAKAVFDAAGDGTAAGLYTALAASFTAASGAAAAGGVNAGGPAPNVPLSTALASVATQMTSLAAEATASSTEEGVKAAYETAYLVAIQVTSYATGAAGNGGDAGNGGNGGAGSFGYGGGNGGDGGEGGNALDASAARGGTGGNGGIGGQGGFGAGGGKGGDGGGGGGNGAELQSANSSGTGGKGGNAGFGGGVGSTGDGTVNGYGGGGGSGYGGAIFVAKGGTLNITGNATFDGNSVFGGSSQNEGEAGQAAGSDLFMMKGSSVTLNPGQGNTITFNGTIADDSRASIEGSSIAAGSGAGIVIQSGLVVFNGVNTYSGQTKIEGGVLQAADGIGINAKSNINLAGGVLQTSGVFDRFLGTASDRIQWTGSGGFAAAGGDLTVSLNNGAGLTWDSGSFTPDGSSLLFGSDSADSDVYFKNAINLAGGERTIVNNGGPDGDNLVYMNGVISNGSLIIGDGSAEGAVVLTAANTYSGKTTVKSGSTLALTGGGSIANSAEIAIEGEVDISGSDGDVSMKTLSGSGTLETGENGLIITAGSTDFAGVIAGAGSFTVSGGNQSLSGVNTYEGATVINAGAQLTLKDGGSIAESSGVEANGAFDIATTTTGAEIAALTGSGTVALGAKTLTISAAAGVFSGVIGGADGNLVIDGGTQTLTGTNSFTGETTINADGKLALSGTGSIATSSKVTVDGELDIADTAFGATVKTLAGSGDVTLGSQTLSISNGSTTFAGDIGGAGGVTVEAGTQTLSGVNSYEGATLIDSGAKLALIGEGSIAASSGVESNGDFDISGTTTGADIATLSGNGTVSLGASTLAIKNGSTSFDGVIGGSGNLVVDGGTQTLTGTNTYSGETTVAEDGTLRLSGTGSIATSSKVTADGVFDISSTTVGATITTLAGSGEVTLGDRTLSISAGSTDFGGAISGTGAFTVDGGNQSLSGSNSYTGKTNISSGATLTVTGDGTIEASSEVAVAGTLDISTTNNGAQIVALTGDGVVTLGAQTLTVSDAFGTFSGGIGGVGGFTVAGGTQTLTGANSFTGVTTVADGAKLDLEGTGSIADSSKLSLSGEFDISQTSNGASIKTLEGDGDVVLGSQTLSITDASTIFSGGISGTGTFNVVGGTQTLQDAAADSEVLASNGGTVKFNGGVSSAGLVAGSGGTVVTTDASATGGLRAEDGGVATMNGGSANGLAASNGGSVTVNGGVVDGGPASPALTITNGGTIETYGTSVTAGGPTAVASFDEAGKVANLTFGSGTTIDGNNGTLLSVDRSGAGSDGIVNLVIANDGAVNGDILDQGTKTGNGGTNVRIAENASWTGLVDAASFYVESGGEVNFADNSRIDGSLILEDGANIFGGTQSGALEVYGDATVDNGALTGNIYMVGNLDLNGTLSPGASPGTIAVGGNLTSSNFTDSLFEMEFGVANPVAGVTYDQFSVGGNATGILPVRLASWNSTRSTELGNIEDIELIRVGGDEDHNFTLANRLTQNGHELLLDRRVRQADAGQIVAPSAQNEEDFFGVGDVVVYGVKAVVQEETVALAALPGIVGRASLDMIGTKVERRGIGNDPDARPVWLRVVGTSDKVDDVADYDHRLYFSQIGADLFKSGNLRVGVLASIGTSQSDIETDTGTADLQGDLYSGGVMAHWSSDAGYVDVVGQYGFGDWTFRPTSSSETTASSRTASAVVEAGVSFGSDTAKVTPWAQVAYQNTSFDGVKSEWFDDARFSDGDALSVRGGLRAESRFEGFSSYADLSVSQDISDTKTVTVDGFDYASGTGGMRVELGLGVDVSLGGNLSLTSSVKGRYGVETGEIVGYQGQANLKASW